MTDIQRYEPWPQEWPMEDANGDLVTYEDHVKIVQALKTDLAELVDALRECHDALHDHAKMYPHMVKGFTHDAEKRAAVILSKIKETTK